MQKYRAWVCCVAAGMFRKAGKKRAVFLLGIALATVLYSNRTSAAPTVYKEIDQVIEIAQEKTKNVSFEYPEDELYTKEPAGNKIQYATTTENPQNEVEPDTVFVWIERCSAVLGADGCVPDDASDGTIVSLEDENGTVHNIAGVSWVGYFLEDGTELELVEDAELADGYASLVDEYGGKYVMELQAFPEDRDYTTAYATVITEPVLPEIEELQEGDMLGGL